MDVQAAPAAHQVPPHHPYPVTVDEYVRFRRDGFLVVKGLVSRAEVDEINAHTDAIMTGDVRVPGLPAADQSLPLTERRKAWERLHMAHRVLAMHERFLLHPRIIDVLEALIGPDVLALQTMLFFKQPGQAGQGYHQDAYYIPTQPDTLCGAWLALDPATEENGCLWMTVGSQHEPIYPDDDVQRPADRLLDDIDIICNASHPDTTKNTLSRIAAKYSGAEVKVEAEPGDVVFFGGHVLHRSHANHATYSRRAFVGHYCNARSRVPWNHGQPYDGDNPSHLHILARGTTPLPYGHASDGKCGSGKHRVLIG